MLLVLGFLLGHVLLQYSLSFPVTPRLFSKYLKGLAIWSTSVLADFCRLGTISVSPMCVLRLK